MINHINHMINDMTYEIIDVQSLAFEVAVGQQKS